MKKYKKLLIEKYIVVFMLLVLISLCYVIKLDLHDNSATISETSGENILLQEDVVELIDCLVQVDGLIVYNEGVRIEYPSGDRKFDEIISELQNMLSDAREMPALGVSLDDSTRMEMKTGLWLEMEFEERLYHNDMPFDSLLVNVVSKYSGFNIIRRYDDKYEGRCFYIDLMNGKTMSGLQSVLMSIN